MNPEVHALAGAYALDALPPDEAAAFADHLQECAPCRQEVAEMQVTATQLGLQVAQTPPAGLRDRILQAAHDTRQVPPAPPGEAAPPGVAVPEGRAARGWPRLLLAAAAVVLAVLGGTLLGGQQLADDAGPARSPFAAVLQAPDAHSATARVRGGGSLTLVSSARLGRAVVLSERLPRLSPGRVYQLWLVDRAGHARSANILLGPDVSPSHSSLVKGVRSGEAVAITREPAGGSERPSMRPLALVQTT
jgi:anti-sigma-K factor RskA